MAEATHGDDHDAHGGYGHDAHGHDHKPTFIKRWLFSTNHKDIGTLYLTFSFTMFLTGGVMALLIRSELFEPGLQIMRPEFFNQLTTMHGLIMVFGAIMPAFVGFANWMVPLQIGASDMAFARMNNFSFWLLPVAAVLLVGSFFAPGGATAAGWTLYASTERGGPASGVTKPPTSTLPQPASIATSTRPALRTFSDEAGIGPAAASGESACASPRRDKTRLSRPRLLTILVR